jgi:hypothetical protein
VIGILKGILTKYREAWPAPAERSSEAAKQRSSEAEIKTFALNRSFPSICFWQFKG